ncbi:MAG: hypothetical protein A2836_01720 [Candidatus Taylorbacteria bacterium RIFCSPHIGHO2_01_FULL_45_63]|uniref:Plasmid stabilization protein n=1 Tax=Candidatus Taylorbacteria bacterium RIFCSPHIGHO2_02_FULL_45_35 TaxID=1802311 RepID=A0A1G2MS33_9BACT|nr:MAG: hypothetical protein A2836_01720 [Candidatus Taylorbacteria bacterium RIFCSPHIGHO2_01_FULL_45_63]OHA26675.1 MAG: hypothetical protein A3D56_02625 [Candidatus Taylorbacteria bacterium RIFCSPHIGHO2_02_FULL_45_35]OHA32588.1 MAG: hypothetical protein A3A22_01935 [Candidatus Taylorbacteria bacterium RIFCSPLOWO2_01_FULL_45_34b]
MVPYYHSSFKRDYGKLPKNVQTRFDERLVIFLQNQFHPLLKNHPLHGAWVNHRSINITADVRAIFKLEGATAIFVAIGTHNKLYE